MKGINYSPANFYSYMKQLAVRHKQINHTDSESHFFRGELEEFYLGLRNKVNFPALIAEGYALVFPETDRKQRETSFIIAQSYSERDDYDSIDAANNLCEIIGDEILRKLNEDDSNNNCVTFTAAGAVQIQNEAEKYVGLRYTVIADSPFEEEPDQSLWRDE